MAGKQGNGVEINLQEMEREELRGTEWKAYGVPSIMF